MKEMNHKLVEYIEGKIFPRYQNNIGGHGMDHINQVIQRSFEIVEEFNLEVDPNMVYVIAAYHDIGYVQNPEKHEEVSAQMFFEDKELESFFREERSVIAEAIVDHRASLEYEARSVYGKIISSADREISVENMLIRSLQFQKDKHREENPSLEQIMEYSYQKLSKKYGREGYAKMYFPDQKYQSFLAELQSLMTDKNRFQTRERELAKRIHLMKETEELGEAK